MNLWFRLIRVLIASLFAPKYRAFERSVLEFRVWPLDLDLNMHMTNARYLSFMDLGRIDVVARAGLWKTILRQGWRPVVGSAIVRFRRPLHPFCKFTLTSELISWDQKWMYFMQRFETAGTLASFGAVRVAFVREGKIVSPPEVAQRLGFSEQVPAVPEWAAQWAELDNTFRES